MSGSLRAALLGAPVLKLTKREPFPLRPDEVERILAALAAADEPLTADVEVREDVEWSYTVRPVRIVAVTEDVLLDILHDTIGQHPQTIVRAILGEAGDE